MSFASLLNGAECGPVNPLQGAMKGANADWSLQRDRFVPQAGPSGATSASQQQQHYYAAQKEAEQFYTEPQRQRAFDMGAMRQQLPAQTSPAQAKAWEASFSHAMPQNSPGAAWSEEFAGQSSNVHANASRSSASPPSSMLQSRTSTPIMAMQQRMPFRSMMSPSMQHMPVNTDVKGKGKAVDEVAAENAAWDEAFAQFTPVTSDQQSEQQQQQSDEGNQADDDLVRDINAQWRRMHDQVVEQAETDKELAQWEAQFGAQLESPEDYLSAGTKPYSSLEELQQNPPEWEWLSEQRNFQDHEDPFAEGMRLLHSGAPFIQVEQAFEEACRRDDQRVEAWTALGEALASDEKEALAIRALEKAVSIPKASVGPNAESAWISLAISYINEAQDSRALLVLEQWLHKMYPGLQHASPLASMASQAAYENPWANHQKVINLFIDAARAGPAARAGSTKGPTVTDAIDADVQIGLGVLLYSNSDYDLAKDCFEAALSVKPDDYVLWNRLGATMANGGHPEDAIQAYRRALELRPHFTRSLYNLSVSCMNIGCYKEAAEHLLTALDMQGNNGKGSESDGLWQTLRRAMLCLDRQDLATLALPGADTSQFRNKGFDF